MCYYIAFTVVSRTYGFCHTYTSVGEQRTANTSVTHRQQISPLFCISSQTVLQYSSKKEKELAYVEGKRNTYRIFLWNPDTKITLETVVKTWDKSKVDFKKQGVKM